MIFYFPAQEQVRIVDFSLVNKKVKCEALLTSNRVPEEKPHPSIITHILRCSYGIKCLFNFSLISGTIPQSLHCIAINCIIFIFHSYFSFQNLMQ